MPYKVFIGHLAPDTRDKDLERFLKDHGFTKSVEEVVVKTGYGFVNFDNRQDADDCIYELNEKELLGSRLQVEYAKQSGGGRDERGGGGGGRYGGGGGGGGYSSKYGRPYNTEYRVIIENLSTRCSWQDVKDYFRQAGEVTFAKCHREKMGEGVVEFASSKDMRNAIRKLDDTELFGKRVRLRCENGGGAGGAGRDSRSRSRSRSPKRRSPSRSPPPRGGGGGGGRGRSPRSVSRSPRGGRSPSRSPSNR